MISPSVSKIFTSEEGFGFASLIILISFLALSSAMVFTMMTPITGNGSVDQTFQKMGVVQTAIAKYRLDHAGAPPNQLDDLVNAVAPPCTVDTNTSSSTYRKLQGWCGPYINQGFVQNPTDFKTDSWGTVLQYDKVNVKSCGPNKICGDADDLSLQI